MQQAISPSNDGPGVDERLPTPLYHQIFLILRDKILDGSYAHDSVVPSEQELGTMFGVSRITAKRALDELAASDLVVRQRGRGTRVRYQAPSPPVRSSVEGLLENLLAMGLETEVRLLAFGYVRAAPAVARALACPAGTTVQRAERVRLLEGDPFSYLTTYVPEAIGRTYSQDDLAGQPLLVLLERQGITVNRAEQTIGATLADNTVAPLLDVGVGSPLLRINRIVYDQTERPVEYITALYRPDRYQYRMDMTRVHTTESRNASWSPAG